MKPHRNTPQLRSMAVRDLTSDECRRLLYHNHGRALPPMRRKAYLLKAYGDRPSAFFKPDEVKAIEQAIAEGI